MSKVTVLTLLIVLHLSTRFRYDGAGGQVGYIRQPFLGGGFAPKLEVMDRTGEEPYATSKCVLLCYSDMYIYIFLALFHILGMCTYTQKQFTNTTLHIIMDVACHC